MDAKTLGETMDRYASGLVLFARQWSLQPEDVVQEAFVRLATKSPTPDPVGPWLYHVVRQLSQTSARSDRRRRHHERNAAQATPWFQVDPDAALDGAAVSESLGRQPVEQREVIIAHLWGGLSFAEIGCLLEISAATAHRRYWTGLNALREEFGESCVKNSDPNPGTRSKPASRG